jgi:hypothetical protein
MTIETIREEAVVTLTAADKRGIAPRASWYDAAYTAHSIVLRRQAERLRADIEDLRAA